MRLARSAWCRTSSSVLAVADLLTLPGAFKKSQSRGSVFGARCRACSGSPGRAKVGCPRGGLEVQRQEDGRRRENAE
jgi:hypothetical protein